MDNTIAPWILVALFGLFAAAVVAGTFMGREPDPENIEAQKTFLEVRRLFLAASVLVVLVFLLVLGVVVAVWGPSVQGSGPAPGMAVFESLVKVIPPIISGVLAFYFGQAAVSKAPAESQGSQQPTRSTKGGVVQGTVTKPDGAPAPQASVVLSQGGVEKDKKTADTTGKYSIEGVTAGDYDIRASLAETTSDVVKVTVTAGGSQTVNLKLK